MDEQFDLVVAIKEGDPQSLELLFRRMYPRLSAYARKFLNDTYESEEIVQELFYKIWVERDRLDENQSLSAYLFTSVKNRCLNALTTRKSRTKHAELMRYLYLNESSDFTSSHNLLVAKELERDFEEALKDLPPECKRIFELSRFDGLRYKEIALQLNISIKTVETQISRALAKLRLQLREHMVTVLLFWLLIK
ncbi:MAG: RNA polymerase sigma-70 factor [Chryseolinea sp.]